MTRIVVGVDGSPSSRNALAWAARQARLTGARLEVVHAFHFRAPSARFATTPAIGGAVADIDVLDRAWEQAYAHAESGARELVREELDRIDDANDVDVKVITSPGRDPRDVLVEHARGADLLVVGSRGLGGLRGMALGSVSRYCVNHAPCAVTVVRDDAA